MGVLYDFGMQCVPFQGAGVHETECGGFARYRNRAVNFS